MATGPDAAAPSFPLLWDVLPSCGEFNLDDHLNLSLNMDGKGVYLPGLSSQLVSSSHRLDLPFPLRSAITGADYQPRGSGTPSQDGAALPLLAGDLSRGGDRDPIEADVTEYWELLKKAQCAFSSRVTSSTAKNRRRQKKRPLSKAARGICPILDQVEGTADDLPNAAHQLRKAMPLVHFLTRNPAFKGWDSEHNWLYGGGCVAVMNRSQKILHTCGRNVAVAELVPREDGEDGFSQCEDGRPTADEDTSSRLVLRAEDEALLTWPDRETVLQIEATDARHEAAAVRSVSSGRYYLRMRRRLTCVDQLASEEPVSAVCCHPEVPQRWALVDTSGRLTVRNSVAAEDEMSVQMPEEERQTGWFGVDPAHDKQQFHVASWERLFSVDVRVPEPVVLFRLSDNTRLFTLTDRLHAVRASALRPHLTLLTSSRHLVVVDARQPRTPWLRSRLTVQPGPVYLSCSPAASGGGRGGAGSGVTELVTVGSQADHHVQALVFDWSAGAELGSSRLLGCARPPLEAFGAPGLETVRRLKLPLAGLAVHRSSGGVNHLYTTNGCGDVFVHPLVANHPSGDGIGKGRGDEMEAVLWMTPMRTAEQAERGAETEQRRSARERREARTRRRNRRRNRRQCRRLVTTWRDTVEEQRCQRARSTALRYFKVAKWPGHLRELLDSPPPEPECSEPLRWCPPEADGTPRPAPERTPQRVRSWLSKTPLSLEDSVAGTPGPDRTPGPGQDQTDRTPGPGQDQTDRTPGPGQDQTDRTPGPGQDQTDRTPGPGQDQTDRTPGPGQDQTDWTPGPGQDQTCQTPRRGVGVLPHSAAQPSDSEEDESPPPASQAGNGSSTDCSTPPHSEIEDLLMQWDTDVDASDTDAAPLSVAEELTASAMCIPGSQRRHQVPRWQRRRRLSSGSSYASSRTSASRAASVASSTNRSAASGGESGNESSVSGAGPASSLITPARPLPARPLPAVSQAAAFQQFSLDLFDD